MFNNANCPVCKSSSFKPTLTCKDYTVSQEKFVIVTCDNCHFKFTNPRPFNEHLGNYYKSEDYISHSNTKKGLVSSLYHLVRAYTLNKKVNLLSKYVSRGTLLDYGCGTGMFLNSCQNAGWKSYGIEPDIGARTIANKMGLNLYSDKGQLDLEMVNLKFDVISLWHVLEHVTDLDETLHFFKEKLNDAGVLIIAVPNHTSFDAHYYQEFWAAYDLPRHLYHFHKETIVTLLSRFDFRLIETRPMKFDSFYVSMLSEKYKVGSINYFRAFVNGLRSNFKAKRSENYSSIIYVFKKK